jgi:hypothetical protein
MLPCIFTVCWLHCKSKFLWAYVTGGACGFSAWKVRQLVGCSKRSYCNTILLSLPLSQEAICHGSGSQSLASHHRCPGLCPHQSMWDLWWTKCHWDRFSSELFGFPCHYHSTVALHTRMSSWEWTIGMLAAAVQRNCVVTSTWITTTNTTTITITLWAYKFTREQNCVKVCWEHSHKLIKTQLQGLELGCVNFTLLSSDCRVQGCGNKWPSRWLPTF